MIILSSRAQTFPIVKSHSEEHPKRRKSVDGKNNVSTHTSYYKLTAYLPEMLRSSIKCILPPPHHSSLHSNIPSPNNAIAVTESKEGCREKATR